MSLAQVLTSADWAARITASWRASFESIIETGRLIAAAKTALAHGEFLAMVENDLPFGPRTAQRLMAVAADPRIANTTQGSHFPANWRTLYDLTRLEDEDFDGRLADGTINPEMARADAARPSDMPPMLSPASEESAPQPAMPNAARAIAPSRVEPTNSLDFFPTPPWATRALIKWVLPVLGVRELRSVWEPACGEGHMAEALAEYSAAILATDIKDYGYGNGRIDFLSDAAANEHDQEFDWIITNPPFEDRTEQFVLRALDLARVGIAMFVRLQWLETIGRYERIFKRQPPTLISFFAERVPLHKGEWKPDGDTLTAYIWLVWIKDRLPRAPFWIPPGQREACSQPDDAERFTAHPVIKRAFPIPADTTPAPDRMSAAEEPAGDCDPLPSSAGSHNSDDGLELPKFLDRNDPACRFRSSLA